jgi:hypothetical protein
VKTAVTRLWRQARARARDAAPPDPEAIRADIRANGLTARSARRLADALQRRGDLLQAADLFHQANRMQRDAEVERHLVRLRNAAFAALDRRSLPSPSWPPFVPDDAPGQAEGPPVVQPHELTPATLRNGILRHGCVLVRGLVPGWRIERLVRAIDSAFEGHDRWVGGGGLTPPVFDPLECLPGGEELRGWVRDGLGVLAVDSPAALFEFLETVYDLGIDRLISTHLGERIALSAEKCTLRRVDSTPTEAYWHQDGAFMGEGIRTVNAWFSLSRCGSDAPGLDIVPRRLPGLLPQGGKQKGVEMLHWAVSPDTIARELPGVPIWRPQFEPGDVLFMDELLLHRTAAEAHMPRVRYAIESWFFAASVYPDGVQTPILV